MSSTNGSDGVGGTPGADLDDVITAVKAFLEAGGWSVTGPGGSGRLAMRVAAGGAEWDMAIVVTPDSRIVVYSFLPRRPDRPVADVDTVIARVNAGMILGNFEFDLDEGSVTFKTSIGVAGVAISDQLLGELIYPNVATVEHYLPVFAALAGHDSSVADILRLATSVEG